MNFNDTNVNMPGIYGFDENFINPTITSPYSELNVSLYQTKETLMDPEDYNRFLKNVETLFRNTRDYKYYKSFLMSIGMNRCQFHSNISSDMDGMTIEMHHNMLSLFDITFIICEHMLNTQKYITEFDLVYLLEKVHKEHKVQLVMLSLTPHQLYHNSYLFVHPKMCFGKWWEFLEEYKYGITTEIANKILSYLNQSINEDCSNDYGLLELRDKIKEWSEYNEYCN